MNMVLEQDVQLGRLFHSPAGLHSLSTERETTTTQMLSVTSIISLYQLFGMIIHIFNIDVSELNCCSILSLCVLLSPPGSETFRILLKPPPPLSKLQY
jgi:hypothetical protein